jgi:hypothetical protein
MSVRKCITPSAGSIGAMKNCGYQPLSIPPRPCQSLNCGYGKPPCSTLRMYFELIPRLAALAAETFIAAHLREQSFCVPTRG